MTTTHLPVRRRTRLLVAAVPLALLAATVPSAASAATQDQAQTLARTQVRAPIKTVTISDVVTPVYGDALTFSVRASGGDNFLVVHHGTVQLTGPIEMGGTSSATRVSIPTLGRFRAGVQYKLQVEVSNEVDTGTATVTFTPRHIPSQVSLAATTIPYGSPLYGRLDPTVVTSVRPGGGTMALQRGSGVTARDDLRTDGTFALNDPGMTPGAYPGTAVFYEGDENYAANRSGAGTVVADLTVTKTPTTTASALTVAKVTQGGAVEVLASTVPSLADSVADVHGIIEVHAAVAGSTEFTQITEVANPGGRQQVRIPITEWAATHPGFWTIRTVNHGTSLAHGSASDTALQVVAPGSSVADTATALDLGADSATVGGDPVTATAHVTSGSGTVGAGSVAFAVAGQVVATVPVGPDGRASASLVAPTSGDLPVTATYLGTATYGASVSLERILTGTRAVTVTTATAPAQNGGVLPIQVRAIGSSVTPTGSVVVSEGSNVLGSVALAAGRAGLRLPVVSPGRHVLTVAYAGDARAQGSRATITVTVTAATKAPSVTRLKLRKQHGGRAKLEATVSARTAATGAVQVLRGGKVLATGRLVASGKGVVVLVVKGLRPGTHRLTARYLGSASVAGSLSKVLKIRVR